MLRKTKKWVLNQAQSYAEALRQRFPSVEVLEVIPGKVHGADALIRFRSPVDNVEEVLDTAVKLQFKWHDEQGVDLLVTVTGTGPVS